MVTLLYYTMDIDDYEPPNVLFLKGCFLDDCDTIEDLFDEKLMNAGIPEHIYGLTNTEYNKIPHKFTSIDDWPKNTNLKCWQCDCSFQSIPIFIPKTIETNGNMDVLGNFCSWNCASLYINLHFNSDQKWENHSMLKILYRVFTEKDIDEIIPAPPKTDMVQYGGKQSLKEYREALLYLNDRYTTAIRHNSIDHLDINHNNEFEERTKPLN